MVDLRFLFENLFINKYDLKYAKRISTNTLLVQAQKRDEFGRLHNYEFYFFSDKVEDEYVGKFKSQDQTYKIMIGIEKTALIDFTIEEFFDTLETTIDPGIYLRDDISMILGELGHNSLPKGMLGEPDDLFEIYAKDSLQFIFGGKGRRYGKERSFESVPDGAVISNNRLSILFDAKAYKEGYNVSADDLKRYENYVNKFNGKYSLFTDRVFSFLVVSGHFSVGDSALENRAKEMYSKCQTILTFISSKELAEAIRILKDNASIIETIDWRRILVHPVFKTKYLLENLKEILKDKIK